MPVTIRIGDLEATVDQQVWQSANPILRQVLTALTCDPAGYSPADPWPDMTLARNAVARIGGKIINAVPDPPGPRGAIY